MSENAVIESKFSAIIHGAAIAAAAIAAGMAQISESQPESADSIPIVGIQGTMLSSITSEFNAVSTQTIAVTIIGTCLATILGRTASKGLLGRFPDCGKALNATTAAVITEIIGWCAVAFFKKIQAQNASD